MSETLDHQGADFRVEYKEHALNYQVKKITQSREVRREKKAGKKLDGEFITIEYRVPNYEHIRNPRRKDGKGLYKDYQDFKKEFLDTGFLRVLPNGFVLFTPLVFEDKKKALR